MVYTREARQSGRPDDKDTATLMEAGQCRRPYGRRPGSLAMQEAHVKNLDAYGSRSTPEASWRAQGKPDKAGGPVISATYKTWKPVHAGDHIIAIREARQNGRPDDKTTQ